MKTREYIFGAIIALLSFTTYSGCKGHHDISIKYMLAKKEIVSMNQNIENANGSTQSAINDLESEKSLSDSLRAISDSKDADMDKLKQVISDLQESGKEIVGLSKIEYVYVDKIDTVNVTTNKLDWTHYYYPNKEKWTTSHQLWIQNDSVQYSSWVFKPVEFDLVLSEDEIGVYSVSMSGSDYLKVNNLQVNMLPIKRPNVTLNQFDWLVGGGYRFDNEINLHLGARFKSVSLFSTIATDKTISANVMIGI